MRANHNHRPTGIINSLAKQIAAEASLLALEHVAQRFELASAAPGESLAALGIVDEGVDRLLKHALLIANNHIRGAKFDESLEAIVAVDHSAVKIVQV